MVCASSPATSPKKPKDWFIGDYEGLKSSEIHMFHPNWDIWKDGYILTRYFLKQKLTWTSCPGGESVEEMQARVDRVIDIVKYNLFHSPSIN